MGKPAKRKAREPKKGAQPVDQLQKLDPLEAQTFEVTEELMKHVIIVHLLTHGLAKAIGRKRTTLKLEAAEEQSRAWLNEVRQHCRRIALESGQVNAYDYYVILSMRAGFGDLPTALPDFRGRRTGSPSINHKKVRLRYQELLSHLKARPAQTPEDLQRLAPGLPLPQATELVWQKDYVVAATLTAREFETTPPTILSKIKGIPMSVASEFGEWQLDSRGYCTFRPFIKVKGKLHLGKPISVRGIGQLPR